MTVFFNPKVAGVLTAALTIFSNARNPRAVVSLRAIGLEGRTVRALAPVARSTNARLFFS